MILKKALEFARGIFNLRGNRAETAELGSPVRLGRGADTRHRGQPPGEEQTAVGADDVSEKLDPLTVREQLLSLVKTSASGQASQKLSSAESADESDSEADREPKLIPQSVEERPSPWRTLWLTQLVCLSSPEIEEEVFPSSRPDNDLLEKETRRLLNMIFSALDSLTCEINSLLGSSRLRISTTRPAENRETLGFEISGGSREKRPKVAYYRCRASTSSWSLSVRAGSGIVEFFLVPGSEVMLLTQAESESRLKARLRLNHNLRGDWWTLDGLPVSEVDLKVLVRNLFKDLVLRSVGGGASDADTLAQLLNLEGERLTQAIHQIVMEKQNLVQKIVMQQEEIQNRIARDLHDAVIADVMLLKRSLSEDRKLSDGEINQVLDRITGQLREICHDLAPRDLKDWGLQTVIEDMLEHVAERIGADCALNCESEIPDLPNAVQLHIFRIVQECLNNIEKYSAASRVVITLAVSPDTMRLTIEDNGKGFSPDAPGARRSREGGRGMGSIRERAELIRAFYPANLSVESVPDRGSRTVLEIALVGGWAKG